jgi:hypothetical protein
LASRHGTICPSIQIQPSRLSKVGAAMAVSSVRSGLVWFFADWSYMDRVAGAV